MEITGMMIYYYFVCKRKLWYFINQINMEQNSELVAIGKVVDETTYKKEKKSILIDNTISKFCIWGRVAWIPINATKGRNKKIYPNW